MIGVKILIFINEIMIVRLMSSNMTGRAVEYRVKSGARATLTLTIKDDAGVAKNLNDTVTYSTGKWKVWKPDGTLIINGDLVYDDRPNGVVSYRLSASDTVIANAGIWEGEVELINSSSEMTDQTKSFNFIIEESY